jgi:hypothetical protein
VGWRNIIEKMHMTATLTKWYEEHGRHEIFAGGKKVKLDDAAHSLLLRDNIVTTELQHDLDKLGIAKNAREEKTRARDLKQKQQAAGQASEAADSAVPSSTSVVKGGQHRGPQKHDEAYNARMASLYREVVLKEKPVVAENGFIPLGALLQAKGNGNGHGLPPFAKDAKDEASSQQKPQIAEPVAGD